MVYQNSSQFLLSLLYFGKKNKNISSWSWQKGGNPLFEDVNTSYLICRTLYKMEMSEGK